MATIKVKLRFSSVTGRAGTIFYQVTHRRAIDIAYLNTDVYITF